ncbi:EAL domain-containing protein [Lysobacter sp. 2RAF19]
MSLHLAASHATDDRESWSPTSAPARAGRQGEGFDDLLALALRVLDAPLGLVAMAEAERFRPVAQVGYGTVPPQHAQVIGRAMKTSAAPLLVSHDAAVDPRFCDDPAICTHGVRFVSSIALIDARGARRGLLIVADRRPRALLTPEQREILQHLARTAARMFVRAETAHAGFDPARTTVEGIERRRLDLDLRRACRDGEFELHYQPQVDLATGTPTGAEALLRWRHPERGLLAPGAFIDALSHHALAPKVGRWILERACRDAAAWPCIDGRCMTVGINLFPAQFHDGHLLDEVEGTLSRTGLAPAQLELELAGYIALRNDGLAERRIARLRERGVRVSLEDFGTGLSSLALLHRLPIDRIKIDHALVRAVLDDQGDATMVRAIAQLARKFELGVVAKGVETATQAAYLHELGCDQAQGFLYARALPASAFDRWLATQAPGETIDG